MAIYDIGLFRQISHRKIVFAINTSYQIFEKNVL